MCGSLSLEFRSMISGGYEVMMSKWSIKLIFHKKMKGATLIEFFIHIIFFDEYFNSFIKIFNYFTS